MSLERARVMARKKKKMGKMRMRKKRFLPKPPRTSQRMRVTTWMRPRERSILVQ